LVLATALSLFLQWLERPEIIEQCAVVSIYDGDTLTVRCGIKTDQATRLKVRVWGIDAPELAQRPWGGRARDRLREIAKGPVKLEKIDRDTYGRTVARVLNDGEDLGLRLVREGDVAVYTQYNDDRRYLEAAREAKRQRLGIWSRRGQQQAPWEWREQHSSR
jgi:endonuclease YncB( thermonuclease family)